MRLVSTADLWWKSAVVYCAEVKTFLDTNGDGYGDFAGVTERIDYLADLGVTCLWLMPIHPSPGVDDGYDITDYLACDPKLGTLADFVELLETARSRGIRVIIDFVMNHTSDQHPWFKQARKSLDNPYRDYYVWRSTPPPDSSDKVAFPDKETGIWELDETTGQWYLHNFYRQQPDLNTANPAVREEITRMLGLWLKLGVSGFRIDAVPFLFERDDVPKADRRYTWDPHETLRHLRSFCTRRSSEAVLLGEVNVARKDQHSFFGGPNGDELTMQFDFMLMQGVWLGLARGAAAPIATALRSRPQLDEESQWANFLRNHDELTLDKLTEAQRQEVFDAFAPEDGMRLYDRGIRRRLPTMLGGDPRRVRLAYSLLFSLPGTPVIFYGEEIGMGENLDVPDRYAVRTPMQWSDGRNGGFSSAAPRRLVRPVTEGEFSPARVNVAAQRSDPDSLHAFIKLLISRYRQSPEIGWGECEVLDAPASVLAHVVHCADWAMVAVHNLADEPVTASLTLPGGVLDPAGDAAGNAAGDAGAPVTHLAQLLTPGRVDVDGTGRFEVALEGYGCRWLRVVREGDTRLA